MVNQRLKKVVLGAWGLFALAGMSFNAQAFVTDCAAGTIELNVDGSNACQVSSATQDFLTDPMTVNTEAFFGITDWTFAGKAEFETGGTTMIAGDANIGFSSVAGPEMLDGLWEISAGAWSAWDNIMLVFKDGADTTLVGYLLDGVTIGGEWLTPFDPIVFTEIGDLKAVSHITAYVSGPSQSVPEAGSMALLSIGLLGFLLGRKKLVK